MQSEWGIAANVDDAAIRPVEAAPAPIGDEWQVLILRDLATSKTMRYNSLCRGYAKCCCGQDMCWRLSCATLARRTLNAIRIGYEIGSEIGSREST